MSAIDSTARAGKRVDAGFDQLELFARCAAGFEGVLARELKGLGAKRVRPLKGGAAFFGTKEDAYRVCLWSRVATRIQLVLARVNAADADALYAGVRAVAWSRHVAPDATVAVRAHGTNAQLRNTQFTALKVKDALCDSLREVRGARPNVDAHDPDFALDVSLHRDRATLYVNLSGASLHKRGYREAGVQSEAPLKETLAAGILLAAGWDELLQRQTGAGRVQKASGESVAFGKPGASRAGGASAKSGKQDGGTQPGEPGALRVVGFVDPMCGSGTLAIEAALVAADVAPSLLRTRWGFVGWAQHDADLWERLHAEAERRACTGMETARLSACIVAGDSDPRAIALACKNASHAGVAELVSFHVSDAARLLDAASLTRLPESGLFAVNPPYGQRLHVQGGLEQAYAALRVVAQMLPSAWDLAVVTPDAGIDAALGEVPRQLIACYNGPLEAALRLYQHRSDRTELALVSLAGRECSVSVAEPHSAQFAARLRKVAKERAKWARKAGIACYRIYDADLPDYSLSVDLYQEADSGTPYVRLAEYQAPSHIDPLLADRRFADALLLAPAVLDVDPACVFSKVRKRAKGGGQYQEARGDAKVLLVQEGGFTFEVDLGSYVDTGLFLDHRSTRARVGQMANHARFLNLFAYTGTATVYAAGGGAASTTTVDLSNTYLSWAQRNMQRNGFRGSQHAFVRADVLEWLAHTAPKNAYDLIFCDPPTFSNSKATEQSFDVQRDHVTLLKRAARTLAQGGSIVFSCNLRSFKIDEEALAQAGLAVRDISASTIPVDFERTPKIHRCFIVTATSD